MPSLRGQLVADRSSVKCRLLITNEKFDTHSFPSLAYYYHSSLQYDRVRLAKTNLTLSSTEWVSEWVIWVDSANNHKKPTRYTHATRRDDATRVKRRENYWRARGKWRWHPQCTTKARLEHHSVPLWLYYRIDRDDRYISRRKSRMPGLRESKTITREQAV